MHTCNFCCTFAAVFDFYNNMKKFFYLAVVLMTTVLAGCGGSRKPEQVPEDVKIYVNQLEVMLMTEMENAEMVVCQGASIQGNDVIYQVLVIEDKLKGKTFKEWLRYEGMTEQDFIQYHRRELMRTVLGLQGASVLRDHHYNIVLRFKGQSSWEIIDCRIGYNELF